MCGVFTIISKAKTRTQRKKLRRIAMALGILNEKRGDHSWGLWSNEFPITKDIGAITKAYKFYQRVQNWTAREGGFIAGHTRWATQGGITKANAHPFLVGGLTLVHNGIVDVDGYEKAHAVDSGQLAHAIAEEGFVEAIAKASGSMGLILTEGESLPRVYRSDQELSWIDIGFGWIVSSAKYHIDQALEDADIKVKLSQIESIPEEVLTAPWDDSFTPVDAIAKPYSRVSTWESYDYYRTGYNNYNSYSSTTITDRNYVRDGFVWDSRNGDWKPAPEHGRRGVLSDGDGELGWHTGLQKFISIHDPIWDEDDTNNDWDPVDVICDWCGAEFDMDDAHEALMQKAIEKCPDFLAKKDCMCKACITDAYRLTFQGRNNLRLGEIEKELKNILEKDIHTLSDVTRRAELEDEIEMLKERNRSMEHALNMRWGSEELQVKKEVTA